MTKIKQIARKLDNGFYERVSLGATNTSELVNDKGFITAADLPADVVIIPYAEQYYVRADETIEDVGEEYCRALMECFDENDNLIKNIYISLPKSRNNLLSLSSYRNEGADSSGNSTKVLDFSIFYDDDAVRFASLQVTLITDVNKENIMIQMESKIFTKIERELTFDDIPTENSSNPVTSDGIKTYVDNAIPTNLSALTNDSGFITNTVSNLTNYYTKSETYTQDEVKALIDAITTLNIEVVTELPTENISATTIYLKGSETEGTNDYEEWIYANSDWELIGTTAVDLSNYYNKTEANEQFAKLSLYGDTTINVGRKNNTSIGEYSIAEGYQTTASGSYSHAEGNVSKALGNYSHAEGSNTTASGSYSHAEGSYTKASGNYSHAGGYHTTASSEGSYAEGYETQATGPRAHSEGDNTIASGSSSHVEGYNTIASGKNQHVQGKYNLEDSNDIYAHIVGNGWSGANSNAHTLDWNGNAWFSGDVYIKSTSGTNKDEGSKRLITEEEVNNKIPTTVSQLINDSGYATEEYTNTKIAELNLYR